MQRPAAVSFFGFLNIVFSVFAIFGAFGAFGDLALQAAPGPVKSQIVALMNSNPAYATWVKATIPMCFLYCALLLIAGIGLLRLVEWGRKLSIATGIYAILMNIGVAAANFYFFHPPSTSSSHTNGSPAADLIVAMMGAIFGLIYPVVLIVYMRRPEIIAAFRPPVDPSTPSA
jgi:hypothetical protein